MGPVLNQTDARCAHGACAVWHVNSPWQVAQAVAHVSECRCGSARMGPDRTTYDTLLQCP